MYGSIMRSIARAALTASLGISMLFTVPVTAGDNTQDGALFRQTFENLGYNVIYNPNVSWDDLDLQGRGTPSQPGVVGKLEYVPNSQGTPRYGSDYSLTSTVDSATLIYDVYFDSNFEWVKGGKLNGLAGGTKTSGCDPIDPNGWSVRVMWRANGKPDVYVYDQDRTSTCGDSHFPNVAGQTGFTFSKNTWHRVELWVKMNSSPSTADGEAELYVDGQKIIRVTNQRFTGSSSVDIDTFSFTSFYGGDDSSWSPSTTTTALFDNFSVRSGKFITGGNGEKCEGDLNGIFSTPTNGSCCSSSCGSCGGPGCSGRPGGNNACCTGAIKAASTFCDPAAAPCKFF